MTDDHLASGWLAARAGRLESLIDAIGRAVSWTVLFLVILVAANVLMRYLFSIGWVWMQQLEWHLMSPIALIGMSYALRHGEHVRVDVFYDKFPDRAKRAVEFATGVVAVVLSVLIIKLSWPYVWQSYMVLEGSYERDGLPYRFVLKGFILVGFGLLVVQGLAICLLHVCRFAKGRAHGP